MDQQSFYSDIDQKFSTILTGDCLTLQREENSRLVKDMTIFNEDLINTDYNPIFLTYLSNYLYLRNYNSVKPDSSTNMISAFKDGVEYSFGIIYDYGSKEDQSLKLKLIDRGVNSGISVSTAQFLFIISIEKRKFFLINCDKFKAFIKENITSLKLSTIEESTIIKEDYVFSNSKYIDIPLSEINLKYLAFALK